MSVDIDTNKPDLAKPSFSERRPDESETDYLNREIADSKKALVRTSQELKENLQTSMDLSLWVKQYPWAALGVASVTGFTAAAIVTPKPGQSIGERLSELFTEHSANGESEGGESTSAAAPTPPHPSRSHSILDSLFGLARLFIETFLVTSIRASVIQPTSSKETE